MGWLEDIEREFFEEFKRDSERLEEKLRLSDQFYKTISSDEYVNKVNGMRFACFEVTYGKFKFLIIMN